MLVNWIWPPRGSGRRQVTAIGASVAASGSGPQVRLSAGELTATAVGTAGGDNGEGESKYSAPWWAVGE
jgi:hypothetical protein